jgi:error-prone DNA polymerase
VHPYIERRKRLRENPDFQVPYLHPSLEPALKDTLGVIVFQDQVLEVSMALAGFSAGDAEGLRRAMSRKRSDAAMLMYQERFIEGAVARGVERDVAERVFEQVRGFSGFGFPKAHAAAFGLLAYQSTWLRVHYAPEFLCALLNEQPMGFYPPDSLIHEAQRRGVTVLPPHVNLSGAECLVEPEPAVRMGLGYIAGIPEQEVRQLVEERERERGGRYAGAGDLAARSGASRDTLERLAWAGACDGVAGSALLVAPPGDTAADRRDSLWQMGVVSPGRTVPGGIQLALPLEAPAPPALAELTPWERLLADYGSTRISISQHPLELLRPDLPAGTASSRDLEHLPDERPVTIAGLVVARQRPATANGITFMLLEDEWGTINLIVPPPVFARHRMIARAEPFVMARGRLERRERVINVLVNELWRIERPDLPRADVKHIDSPVPGETTRERKVAVAAGGDLRAVLPNPHSFGRRAG